MLQEQGPVSMGAGRDKVPMRGLRTSTGAHHMMHASRNPSPYPLGVGVRLVRTTFVMSTKRLSRQPPAGGRREVMVAEGAMA